MKREPKILFTDLDDTLLDTHKHISPKNLSAIKDALRAGHYIVINTGRPLAATKGILQTLHLEEKGCYAVTYNGGLIYDCFKRTVLYQNSLPIPYVKYIFAQAEKAGLHCQTYSTTHLLSKKDTPELRSYVARTNIPYLIVPDFLETLAEEPIKILVIDDNNHERLVSYRSGIEKWAEGKISLFFSSDSYLEHVATGVSKGSAMQLLCQQLNVPIERTIAAGDAENDIPMLITAHTGVAMKNASLEIKKYADYITENDCNHSGIAEVIRKFLLT